MLNKIKQKFRRLGIPLTATCTRTAREPGHNNGYGPLPEKVGRRRCKRKGSTTAHFRNGVTPYASLCNRHISNFCLDFHLLTTLRHRGLGRRGTHEILFFPTKCLRIDGMALKTYQTKIKFSALRAWRWILHEQFNMTSIRTPWIQLKHFWLKPPPLHRNKSMFWPLRSRRNMRHPFFRCVSSAVHRKKKFRFNCFLPSGRISQCGLALDAEDWLLLQPP